MARPEEHPQHPHGEPPGQAKPKPGEPGYTQPGQKPETTPPPAPNQDLPEAPPAPNQDLP
jgi:type VI secretion system protein